MKAKIYSHAKLIGTAELQVGDQSMGCMFGQFTPSESYFGNIQKQVWEFWANNKPDHRKWESLRLNAQLENGCFLYPAGGYTISDDPKCSSEPKQIDIAGLDSYIIQDFFLAEPPQPFVEEPWEEISIEQKIASEDELKKEVGLAYEPFWSIFKTNKERHPLADFEFSALCKFGCNDDVLFRVNKPGFDKHFAVIHLTWTGRKETANFPSAEFFGDFDEFKYLRMYPDKAEWEY